MNLSPSESVLKCIEETHLTRLAMRTSHSSLFVGLSLMVWGLAASASEHRYTVNLNSVAQTLDVNACLSGNAQDTGLTTRHDKSWTYLSHHNGRLSTDNRSLNITAKNGCVRYRVDLKKAIQARQARQIDQSWLLNNRSWLWRPDAPSPIYFTFTVDGKPEPVSVPFLPSGSGYLGGLTPVGWTGRIAIGKIEETRLAVGSESIRVGFVGITSEQKRNSLTEWIHEASMAVRGVYGRFPVDNAQVLVASIGKRKEPVPWAEVQRDGAPAVHLFVDPHRPLSEFRRDWTAVHELSHLLLPKMDYSDRWAYEGLASYYQNVARSKSGMLTPSEAWQALRRGFTKGRIVQSGSLATGRSTRHQYWGGAAIYLLADLRLRELAHPTTLSEVLDTFQSEHFPSNRQWQVEELMQTLDAISESTVFTALLGKEVREARFPISQSWETRDPLLLKHKSAIFTPSFPSDLTND